MKKLLAHITTAAVAVLVSVFLVSSASSGGVGAIITQIQGSDQLSDLDTLINTVSSELNTAKMEVSTTSVDSITTLSNLTTTGTVGTGTWQADTIAEIYGGTGQSSYSAGDLLYADAANSLATLATSSADQVLTIDSNTGFPVWASGSVDETLDYNWTGLHQWTGGASSTVFSVFDMVWFGGTATSTFSSNGDATIGNNLTVTGTFSAPGGTTATSTVFTSSGTWNKPDGVDTVKVTVVGAGGGGGGVDNTTDSSAAGGGAGGYAETEVSVSSNVTVTVGSGGTAGTSGGGNGGNGGNSSFAGDVTVTANGGSGGDGDNSGAGASGGSGGSTTNADLGVTGQSGEDGYIFASTGYGGAGGSSPLGQGGYGHIEGNAAGDAASGFGAGGGGAVSAAGANAGGAGSDGIVIVEWQEY